MCFCICICPSYVALIRFSCQDAFLDSSFVDAVGYLRVRRKHILLLYKQRGSVCIRDPLSELRVAVPGHSGRPALLRQRS